MNVLDPIIYQARVRPHFPALVSPRAVVTYAQLVAAVEALATHLLARGIETGQVVAVSFGSGPLNTFAMLALARLGAISIGSLNQIPSSQLPGYVGRLGCVAVCHPAASGAIDGLQSLVVEPALLKSAARGITLPPMSRGGDEVWRLLLSSGTTGLPKAIPWTHASTMARVMSHMLAWPANAGDRMLTMMSMNGGLPLAACLAHLSTGGAIVFPANPTAAEILDPLERFGVTFVVSSPFLFTQFLNALPAGGAILPALRKIAVGGGRIPDAARNKASDCLAGQTTSVYGATEVGMVAHADLRLLAREADAVGRILPTATVEAADDQDRPLPFGEEGFLRIRTLSMSNLYYGDPETTARMFRNSWFYPGDIGRVDADGVLRVTGRTDEVVNISGGKVNSARVEGALAGGRNVADVAVTALVDEHGAASLGVAVVAKGPVDRDALADRCRALVQPSIPIRIVVVDAIPRNAMGKVLRGRLAEQLNQAARAE